MEAIANIKSQLSKLSLEEQYQLKIYLTKHIDSRKEALEQQLSDSTNACPHCESTKIIKWGKFKNKQRFLCQECQRTFTSRTGSAIYRMKRPSDFIDFSLSMYVNGIEPLSKISREFGINIRTAFDWRHRLLISLKEVPSKFTGIVEMDDIWFLYSQKGRKGLKYSRKRGGSKRKGDNNFQAKVLITKERQGSSDLSLVKIGRLSAQDIGSILKGKFDKECILVSDKHKSISNFAKSENLHHETFKAKNHVRDKTWHVQSINQIAKNLKDKLNGELRGVSTKYLQDYVTWFGVKEKASSAEKIITRFMSNKQSWDMFTNIEKLYAKFILEHSVRTYRCPTKRHWKSQFWNFEAAKAGNFL